LDKAGIVDMKSTKNDSEAILHKDEVNENKMRNNQRHKERCRAIAALLWSKEPEITIADMILRDEITVFGCEGKNYAEDTLRDWIKDLAPDRSPGRRTKD